MQRPTSPHLGIYRKQITSVLSIMHRFTGLALVAGITLVVAWVCIAAYRPALYGALYDVLASDVGKAGLIGWTAAFYYHLANGIRHLFWDAGYGFTLPAMNRTGMLVVLFSLAGTGATWYCLMNRGTL